MQIRTSSDDLELIRLIAAAGTLAEAARQLSINHATVFRRLNRIEENLGVRLFDRSRTGYVLTSAGELAIDHAERVADELAAFENKVVGTEQTPAGTVRLTTTDTLLAGPVGSILCRFRQLYPKIDVEIVTSNTVANLERREADLALRPARNPSASLLGRRIGKIELAIYAQHGLATGLDPLSSDVLEWIGPEDGFGDPALAAWFASNEVEQRVHVRTNTLMGMLALTASGNGFSVLPTYLANSIAGLEQLSPPIPELTIDLWLLRHPALRETARIQALADFLAKALSMKTV